MAQPLAHSRQLIVAGINYKKTDALQRGLFAIGEMEYAALLQQARQQGMGELFLLSTCNRTEIYALADDAEELCALLCQFTKGTVSQFLATAYIKYNQDAVRHLFDVASGLDSQILGDYEIVGQLKAATQFARSYQAMGSFMERLISRVLQAAKKIRTHTALSSGTVSVSYAAIQYLKANMPDVADKNILLIGTGKIGKHTCKNLVDYLSCRSIMLINRTDEKAAALAAALQVGFNEVGNLHEELCRADVVIVATNSAVPIVKAEQLQGCGTKTIIDLSMPFNVELAAQQLPGITLINVDDLSKIKDATLAMRLAEVPKACAIIAEFVDEWEHWLALRKPLKLWKHLHHLCSHDSAQNLYVAYNENGIMGDCNEALQALTEALMVNLKTNKHKGCIFIEATNQYLALQTG